MKLISSLLLLVTLSTSIAANENESENEKAEPWLERLATSLQTLNFSTSFVVVKNNQAEPYHWFHGLDENGNELEILSLLNDRVEMFYVSKVSLAILSLNYLLIPLLLSKSLGLSPQYCAEI